MLAVDRAPVEAAGGGVYSLSGMRRRTSIVAVGLSCGGTSGLDGVRRSLCSRWVLMRGGVRRRIIAVGLWWCSRVYGLGKVRRRYHIAVRRQARESQPRRVYWWFGSVVLPVASRWLSTVIRAHLLVFPAVARGAACCPPIRSRVSRDSCWNFGVVCF